jgi:hypothetical protein
MRRSVIATLSLAMPLLQVGGAMADTEIAIRFRGGLLWADVYLGPGSSSLHFLVDTGANCSVIDLNTARSLSLALGPEVTVSGVGTQLKGNWPVKLSATLGTVALPRAVLALDLAKLSAACGDHVDGLIGADLFRGRIVQIDYEAEKIRLLDHPPCACRGHTLPVRSQRCGFLVPIAINDGDRQWVRLDTGCASPLQWVIGRVSPDECTSKLAVGLATISIPQTTTRVRLGNEVLEQVPTGLHEQHIFPGEAGLLGNGLLARFGTVTLDDRAGKVILGPLQPGERH